MTTSSHQPCLASLPAPGAGPSASSSRPPPGGLHRRRWTAAGLRPLLATAAVLVLAAPSRAQTLPEVTATPESAATLFLRSVRSIRWSAAAQFMHPATLDRFRQLVTIMSEADSTGEVRSYLTGTEPAGYATLSAAEVFDRAVGTMIDDMPGLMHALFDRDDEVLGHVAEAGDTAHVVYRTTARLSGAVSEVKVMQLTRTAGGWRIFWSDELEVLDAALRGVPRSRPPSGRQPSGGSR